jgi:Uncharacterized protein family, UPF0114
LFAAVLIIFAYAIAFGFVVQTSPEYRQRLPGWMQVERVGELKRTLIEVILMYLVVDFATDLRQERVRLCGRRGSRLLGNARRTNIHRPDCRCFATDRASPKRERLRIQEAAHQITAGMIKAARQPLLAAMRDQLRP